MPDVTELLAEAASGHARAADELFPIVYDELRSLAAARLSRNQSERTLQATALVHEAYLRLVQQPSIRQWANKAHFFAAAATCMRWILVDQARRRHAAKRGGKHCQIDMQIDQVSSNERSAQTVELDRALEELAVVHSQAAKLVELRYFAGLSAQEAASVLGVSPRTGDRLWDFARSWLLSALRED